MACYVYNDSDGSLHVWGPSDNIADTFVGDLAANGFASVNGLPPLDDTHHWNPKAKTVQRNRPVVKPGGVPDLSDYPADIAATGYVLIAPTDGVTYNVPKWVQPNLQAFYDYCVIHPPWDKLLHADLNTYLHNKTTS